MAAELGVTWAVRFVHMVRHGMVQLACYDGDSRVHWNVSSRVPLVRSASRREQKPETAVSRLAADEGRRTSRGPSSARVVFRTTNQHRAGAYHSRVRFHAGPRGADATAAQTVASAPNSRRRMPRPRRQRGRHVRRWDLRQRCRCPARSGSREPYAVPGDGRSRGPDGGTMRSYDQRRARSHTDFRYPVSVRVLCGVRGRDLDPADEGACGAPCGAQVSTLPVRALARSRRHGASPAAG